MLFHNIHESYSPTFQFLSHLSVEIPLQPYFTRQCHNRKHCLVACLPLEHASSTIKRHICSNNRWVLCHLFYFAK